MVWAHISFLAYQQKHTQKETILPCITVQSTRNRTRRRKDFWSIFGWCSGSSCVQFSFWSRKWRVDRVSSWACIYWQLSPTETTPWGNSRSHSLSLPTSWHFKEIKSVSELSCGHRLANMSQYRECWMAPHARENTPQSFSYCTGSPLHTSFQ